MLQYKRIKRQNSQYMHPTTTTNSQQQTIQQILNTKYNDYIQYLNLCHDGFHSDGSVGIWRHIIMSRDWTQLKTLVLDDCQVDDDGAKLLGSMKWPNLKTLHICQYPYHKTIKAGIPLLLAHEFPKLKYLRLSGNKIGNQGMDKLLTTNNLPQLELLSVFRNNITHVGLRKFPHTQLNLIKQLYLSQNKIGSRGMRLLIKANLPLLQCLGLSECQLGNQGAVHLAKGYWPTLQELVLSQNRIKLRGCQVLVTNNWHNLHSLTLSQSKNQVLQISVFYFLTNSAKLGHFYHYSNYRPLEGQVRRVIYSCIVTD